MNRYRVLVRSLSSIVVATILAITARRVGAQVPDPTFPVTDGTVYTMAIAGRVLYIGGDFHTIGRTTGAAVPVDTSSGTAMATYPEVQGQVFASVDDGVGGWYIGGSFVTVGGQPRANLARIRADGSLDPWKPGADGPVYALARTGAHVFAAGGFTHVGGQPRARLAALNASTGSPTLATPDADATVYALMVSGGLVYVGGHLSHLGGQARSGAGAFDASTGQVTSWNPVVNGDVLCLAAADGTIYIGGEFTVVSGITRHRLAAFDQATGQMTPWNGTADATVRAIAVSGGKVYVGGDFATVGGQGRWRFAALSTRWWQALPWNPGAGGTVTSIVVRGNRVYVGGDFIYIGGQRRIRAAVLDTATAVVAPWEPRANGPVRTLMPSGTKVLVAGALDNVGAPVRTHVAAIDLDTKEVLPWSPVVEQAPVYCIVPRGRVVYIGGYNLTSVGGLARVGAAAVDSATGNVLPWNPAFWAVTTICPGDDRIFIGSYFGSVASVDPDSGRDVAWSRGFRGRWLNSLHLTAGRLFVAGNFSQLDWPPSSERVYSGLVILDPASGAFVRTYDDSFHAEFDGESGLVASGGRVFVGGDHLVAVDSALTDLASWPQWSRYTYAHVSALAHQGRRIYCGGYFSKMAGQDRARLAAIDEMTGALTEWNPTVPPGWVHALAASEGIVYVGGYRLLTAIPDPSYLLDVSSALRPRGERIELGAVIPNPVAVSSRVQFTLDRPEALSLDVFDAAGRRIRSAFTRRAFPAGEHRVDLGRDGLDAGIYWLRLRSPTASATTKWVVMP